MLSIFLVTFLPGGLLIVQKNSWKISLESLFVYFLLSFYFLWVAVRNLIGQNWAYPGSDNYGNEKRILY